MEKFKYEIMGFKFETVQLVDIEHKDNARERVVATQSLATQIKHGDVVARSTQTVLSISYNKMVAYVPLVDVGPLP